jgi:hypothetical protein
VVSRPFLNMSNARMSSMSQSVRMKVRCSWLYLTIPQSEFLLHRITIRADACWSRWLRPLVELSWLVVKWQDWLGIEIVASFHFILYMFLCCRFTARVTEFMKVLDDINGGKYVRTMVNSDESKGSINFLTVCFFMVCNCACFFFQLQQTRAHWSLVMAR